MKTIYPFDLIFWSLTACILFVFLSTFRMSRYPPIEMARLGLQNNTCTTEDIEAYSFLPLPVVGNIERVQPQKLKK